jgi:hypothetical protein
MPMLYGLCGKHPIEVEFLMHCLKFSFQCINSENYLVRNIVRHSFFVSRCSSLIVETFGTVVNSLNCLLLFLTLTVI